MNKEIKVGDWITSESYGIAVCTGLKEDFVQLRYCAIRVSDQKEIWVENGEYKQYVQFLKSADEKSQYVLTLQGPYGENTPKRKM